MGAYLLRRALGGLATVLVVATFVFLLLAATGDPLKQLRARPNVSRETIANLERKFHLNEPIATRYFNWLGDVASGDLGNSFQNNEPVADRLGRAMGVTGQLLVGWLVLSAGAAVLLGVWSATRPYTLGDTVVTTASFIAYCAPVFFWAILLQEYAAVRLPQWTGEKWFYVSGIGDPTGGFGDRIGHLALPVLTLTIATVAEWSRFQRSSMLDVLSADYIRTATAKGLSRGRVVFRHALRNALIPLVTLIGAEIGLFFAGAIVTETVFALPGMGAQFFDSLKADDLPMVLGWILITTVLVVVFNLIVDVAYTVLDPRIRL